MLCKREEYLSSTQEIVDHPLVEQVTGYIEAHIGEEITVEDVAETVHMSKFYFLRKFKEITGMTVHNFIEQADHCCLSDHGGGGRVLPKVGR